MADEISNTTPLWWELQNIPTEVVRELRRRSNSANLGMNVPSPYIPNSSFNFEANYDKYKGPMTPWVRVFSNSTGKSINSMVPRSSYLDKFYVPVDFQGFILKGGEGFYDAFGYDAKIGFNQTNAIIGYEADGKPHSIDGLYRSQLGYSTRNPDQFPQNNNTPSVLPPPGVTKVSVKQSKEFLTYATVNFKCYGLAQLEYLTPFFFTAGINVFIEFGWNLFNQKSLVNLDKVEECWELIQKPDNALIRANKSNGNYGCITGIINRYSFTTTDGFVYDCTMEVLSRQALFAGMRTDNSAKINISNSNLPNNSDGNNNVDFLDLKTFFKYYLPSINKVLQENEKSDNQSIPTKANFLNYIIDNINSIVTPKEKESAVNQKIIANPAPIPQLGMGFGSMTFVPFTPASNQNNAVTSSFDPRSVVNKTVNNIITNKSSFFYDGKPEDRAFIGRLESVYKLKNTLGGGPVIKYDKASKSIVSGSTEIKYTQVSDLDKKTDFDGKDSADEVWMQLDFVFELVNLLMSNSNTKQFYIDISNVVVNAHPNLISCDSSVLIPNPVAPKVNIGTPYKKESKNGGFLRGDDVDANSNVFLQQQPDITIKRNHDLEKRLKKAQETGKLKEFYKGLKTSESFYFACEKARKTFKTKSRFRDDLDRVINWKYYNSQNGNIPGSAAFPFGIEQTINNTKYKEYYYGYLKHIYISKTKLLNIVKSEETKNFKQFINAILNTLNSATENFWKFEIVEGQDKNGNSTLSIVDKNLSNFDELKKIYTLELGSTNNVVKSIDFNVNLSPEQAISVQFGGQNTAAAGLKTQFTEQINAAQSESELNATLTDLSKTPFLKFVDRMDAYQLGLLAERRKEDIKNNIASSVTTIPGTTQGLGDINSGIESLQKYGAQENVLCMCVRQVTDSYSPFLDKIIEDKNRKIIAREGGGEFREVTIGATVDDFIKEIKNARPNYKFLNLPPDMRGKLLDILDDNDYKSNAAKYSGVADNFVVTLKFDGIFSFKNLQVFAINNLPKPYVPGNVVFQVLEVEHEISAGKWETVVTALVRCIGAAELEYVKI